MKQIGLFFLFCLILIGQKTTAQHETADDLVGGEQAFRQYCANCHGPDGDLIADVDLGHNSFRQPYTDEDLVGIILNGIPDTPMPPTPRVTDEQAAMLVAWLRSLGERADMITGNPVRGESVFAGRGNCRDCHMVDGTGAVLGPDLSSIALVRSAAELEQSLREPNTEVQPENRFVTARLESGEEVSGRLLNHDAFSLQVLDTQERLRFLDKAALASFEFTNSGMPSLENEFSEQEIADLVAYLATLRRGVAQ